MKEICDVCKKRRKVIKYTKYSKELYIHLQLCKECDFMKGKNATSQSAKTRK